MKILVYALRDWSFKNIEPALAGYDYIRWNEGMGKLPDIGQFGLILTTEPHMKGWRYLWPTLKGKVPVLALQQGPYWTEKPNPLVLHADKYLVWGEAMRERCFNIPEKVIVTGNPRHDAFYAAETEDETYTLILGSISESRDNFKNIIEKTANVIFKPHPAEQGHKDNEDIVELIRCARKVVFSSTGAGLIAMMMKKPIKILSSPKRQTFTMYGKRPDFVEWMCGKPGATRRVREVIESYA